MSSRALASMSAGAFASLLHDGSSNTRTSQRITHGLSHQTRPHVLNTHTLVVLHMLALGHSRMHTIGLAPGAACAERCAAPPVAFLKPSELGLAPGESPPGDAPPALPTHNEAIRLCFGRWPRENVKDCVEHSLSRKIILIVLVSPHRRKASLVAKGRVWIYAGVHECAWHRHLGGENRVFDF